MYQNEYQNIQKSTLLQVKEVADKFYGTKVDMKMEKQEVVFDTVVTSFHMKFENKVFIAAKEAEAKVKESSMPVRAAILFEMFPFCILFTVSWLCKESSMPVRAAILFEMLKFTQ